MEEGDINIDSNIAGGVNLEYNGLSTRNQVQNMDMDINMESQKLNVDANMNMNINKN